MRKQRYNCPTYSITKDFDWSPTENNKLLFEMTAKYGTPYFSNYINSDMNPSDVRSMCPLHGSEKVLVMNDYSKEFHLSTVRNLYDSHKSDFEYTVLLNGQTKRVRLNRFDNLHFYKIRTVNGHEVILSHNHENLVFDGTTKKTEDLTTEDYLPFNAVSFRGDNSLTYEDGYMVGAFMGDGSLNGDYSVVYSLNNNSKEKVMSRVIDIGMTKFGAKINSHVVANKTCINVVLTSKMLRGLIEDYVSGKALDKELNVKCIGHSLEFRRGIIDGLLDTDGNKFSRRIYTASRNAVTSVTAVLASMGIPTNVAVDARPMEVGRYSSNPVYCIRLYAPDTRSSYKNVFKTAGGNLWFRIESIEPAKEGSTVGYCFEVLDDSEPYFMLPSGLITHNCRLRLDLRELRKKSGGFFGSGESTGSVGVVTINLPALAYQSETEDDFYKRLSKMMDISARSLDIKRKVITRLLEEGLYPYTKRYLGSFHNHFSTIGLVGMNEAAENAKWLRTNLGTDAGQVFAKKTLDFMREKLSDYQEMYSNTLFNLEATPAESTSYRLAKHDVERFPGIITAAKPGNTPYYTNSSHLPVGFTDDVFDALDLQDELQTKYTSGTVFHAFLGQRLPDWQAAATLVRKIAENYRLPYYTLSPTYSICAEHGYISGEHETCPKCGKETEVYTRITGYYRPVKNWNAGKVEEFKNRKTYVVSNDEPQGDIVCESCQIPPQEDTGCTSCQMPAVNDNSNDFDTTRLDGITLIATTTCPNCKLAKKFLRASNVPFTEIFADLNPAVVKTFHVVSAPTLLVPDGNGGYESIVNASNIRAFADNYGNN